MNNKRKRKKKAVLNAAQPLGTSQDSYSSLLGTDGYSRSRRHTGG
jgi:hypothetical protein